MFTDWMGTEFTQGVAFGQFIQLEMLFTYDEVSLSDNSERWTARLESGYRTYMCRPGKTRLRRKILLVSVRPRK